MTSRSGEAAGLPDRATLERRLGTRIVATRRLDWGFARRTDLVQTVDDAVTVTWLDPGEAAARVAVERRVRDLVGPDLPVPAIVGWELAGPHPFLVTSYVAGRAGGMLLDDPAEALLVGALMGGLLRRVSSLSGPDVPASSWLSDDIALAEDPLASQLAPAVRRRLTALDSALAADPAPTVFVHGDFVPVNVLIHGERISALLDWEHAGNGHPSTDAAWWRAIVLVHHRELFPTAWGAFREAAGIESDPKDGILVALAARRMLQLARTSADGRAREAWLERLGRLLGS